MTARATHLHSALQRANSELSVRALQRGAGPAVHRPTQIYLQIASACNLSCYMCSEHNRPPDQRFGRGLISLAPELFARLEKEVFPWSSELYLGVGGEPTFSEHFVDYAERAADANQELHLVTNGTHLERDAVARTVARRVAFVKLSIDAATESNYERIRIGSRWSRLMRGLDKLTRLRAEMPERERGHLSLCFVLMRSNVDELPRFVELAHTLGADAVSAQHVIAMTEASRGESLVLEPERYDRNRAEAEERARSLRIAFDAPAPFAAVQPAAGASATQRDPDLAAHVVPCRSPTQTMVVLYDGRVFACCHPMAHHKMQLGDLRTQSFDEIWNGRLYRNLRVGMSNGDAPKICRTCSVVHSPPPEIEDARELAESPDIAAHYGSRDLGQLGSTIDARELERSGLTEYVADLRRHADALKLERDDWRAHARDVQTERDALRAHTQALESRAAGLTKHAQNLEDERRRLTSDCTQLASHARFSPSFLIARWRGYFARLTSRASSNVVAPNGSEKTADERSA